MGDVIPNTRFRRRSAREHATFRERFRRRPRWEADTNRAMRRFDEIVEQAHATRRKPR